jgi:Na+-transporting NADH:ubiquinone oxidoreductase subunit NqrC
LSVHPEKENIEEKQKEEILNLSEIKQEEVIKESEINNDFNEIEKEKIIDMQNNENYTQVKSEPNAFDIFLEKI